MAGTFVTFEGIDGCGKSTQVGFVAAALSEQGTHVVRLREPGGTAISEKVRALLNIPEDYVVIAVAPLGYPAVPGQASKKKTADEVVVFNQMK
jgi:dTMP kinase